MTQPDSTLLLRSSFPACELDRALGMLVRAAGLTTESLTESISPPQTQRWADGDIEPWLTVASARLGIEIVAVSSTLGELDDMLRRLGPALLRLPGSGPARYLAVLGGGSFGLKLLTLEDGVRRIGLELVRAALIGDRKEAEQASLDALMNNLGLGAAVGSRGLSAYVEEQLSGSPIAGVWCLRPSPGSAVGVKARAVHLPLLLTLLLVSRVLATGLQLTLWWLIGRDVFGGGQIDRSSLTLWALCLASLVPLQLLGTWAQSRLSLDMSATLKESILYGILQLDRDATKGQGACQFFGRAMEGEVSSTAMESALSVLLALVEIAAAFIVLCLGAGGTVAALLVGWVAVTGWLCFRLATQTQLWMTSYRTVTQDLVERMVGYQTRLVQERIEDGEREEDALLHDYLTKSQELDRRGLPIEGVVGAGWLLLGLTALEPVLLSGMQSGAALAVALGGVLKAGGALKQLVSGVNQLVDVWVSWQQIAPILAAGRRSLAPREGKPEAFIPKPHNQTADAPLLRFDKLSLRYAENAPPVLRGCQQEIHAGDRILLEGPSGGGKSTLAMVLAGLRAANAGSIQMRDERSGKAIPTEQLRARVVLVPQFHDNHVLTESLLFNLLLGRGWPATQADAEQAAAVCELLGLLPLLQRMPQGLLQTVGDGGWALSHGERSRVFVARALLQEQAALIILDESFAALDPETLRLSCQGVVAAAPTLLVVAHP